MTIAVGILVPGTHDFVIAADTQETYEAAKLDGQKIMSLTIESKETGDPIGCVVFTGAGRAGYLDAIGQSILKAFLDHDDVTDEKLQVQFERVVRAFFRSHILPFGEAWSRSESLSLSAIVAYQRGQGHGMYANDLTALRQTNCVAVGSGQIAALRYLDRFRPWALTHEAALRLAAYAVYQAKEVDPYCGKQTHVVLLSENRQQVVNQDVVESWEGVFKRVDSSAEQYQLRALGLGIPVIGATANGGESFRESGVTTPPMNPTVPRVRVGPRPDSKAE